MGRDPLMRAKDIPTTPRSTLRNLLLERSVAIRYVGRMVPTLSLAVFR